MPSPQFTDAIALLKADHRYCEDLFDQYKKARAKSRKQALASEICTELKVHMMLEEEIFYPAFRGKIAEDDVDEAIVEHDSAKVLINDIEAGSPDDEYFDAKVKVLGEEVVHHVHEEEEYSTGVFAQCRKTDVDLVALRDQMLARKEELMAQAAKSGLPPIAPLAVNLVSA